MINGDDLPPVGISASRIDGLREMILVKLEALIDSIDVDGVDEMVPMSEAVNQLSEAFMNLR